MCFYNPSIRVLYIKNAVVNRPHCVSLHSITGAAGGTRNLLYLHMEYSTPLRDYRK